MGGECERVNNNSVLRQRAGALFHQSVQSVGTSPSLQKYERLIAQGAGSCLYVGYINKKIPYVEFFAQGFVSEKKNGRTLITEKLGGLNMMLNFLP